MFAGEHGSGSVSLERGDEAVGEERTGEFFFGKRTSGGSHGATLSGVVGKALQGIGEGDGVAGWDDKAAAALLDQAGQPARVVVDDGDPGGEVVEELIRRSAPIKRGDVTQDHQSAIERSGDGPEIGFRDRREEEAVREAEFRRAGREAFLLFAIADEGELHTTVAATLELLGDGEERIEAVGDAMGAGEAGDEIIRADTRERELGALGRMEDLEVGAVGDHRDGQTLVSAGTDAFDDARGKSDAGVGGTVTEELQQRHAAEQERITHPEGAGQLRPEVAYFEHERFAAEPFGGEAGDHRGDRRRGRDFDYRTDRVTVTVMKGLVTQVNVG